ncbi:MAG: type II secretion system protein [Rickettsiales bacterium]
MTAHANSHKLAHSAFSLVELSIVLVILGLLVGGILSGQALIRASELRSVATQQQKFVAAIYTFRDKYFAIPGDMNNAQSIWGIAHATPATCITTAGTGTQTCNGDGDGNINLSVGSNESFRIWQHLANAGLIEGQFDGIAHGATSYSVTGANSPVGRLSNSIWWATWWGQLTGQTWIFDGDYSKSFEFGGIEVNDDPAVPIFRPEELWNIDTKIDDGKPGLGKLAVVAAGAGTLSSCTTTVANNPATLTADYLLSASSPTCAAIFRRQF